MNSSYSNEIIPNKRYPFTYTRPLLPPLSTVTTNQLQILKNQTSTSTRQKNLSVANNLNIDNNNNDKLSPELSIGDNPTTIFMNPSVSTISSVIPTTNHNSTILSSSTTTSLSSPTLLYTSSVSTVHDEVSNLHQTVANNESIDNNCFNVNNDKLNEKSIVYGTDLHNNIIPSSSTECNMNNNDIISISIVSENNTKVIDTLNKRIGLVHNIKSLSGNKLPPLLTKPSCTITMTRMEVSMNNKLLFMKQKPPLLPPLLFTSQYYHNEKKLSNISSVILPSSYKSIIYRKNIINNNNESHHYYQIQENTTKFIHDQYPNLKNLHDSYIHNYFAIYHKSFNRYIRLRT